MPPLANNLNAHKQILRARYKFCQCETLETLRRQQMIVIAALLFLGNSAAPDPRTFAAPIVHLADHAVTFAPALITGITVAIYLVVTALAFAWQRTALLGGKFRGYFSTLPVNADDIRAIDTRMIASRAWLLFVPHFCVIWLLLTAQLPLRFALLPAACFVTAAAWRVATATIYREWRQLAVIGIITLLACTSVALDRTVQLGALIAATIAVWFAPRWHGRHHAHQTDTQPPRSFSTRSARLFLWLGLPLKTLWCRARVGVVVRIAIICALLTLAGIGIHCFGMADRARGLSAAMIGVAIWLTATLYDELEDARSAQTMFHVLPIPRSWAYVSEALALWVMVMPPVAIYVIAIAAKAPSVMAIAATAPLLLFALRGLQRVPSSWRVMLLPAAVIAWAAATRMAISAE
jgi:hypothetical protein